MNHLILLTGLLLQAEIPEPKAVVKAPIEISAYKLGIFDARESVGDYFTYQVYFHGGDEPGDDNKLELINDAIRLLEGERYVVTAPQGETEHDYWVSEDGRTLIVPPVPGRRYVVFFSASNTAGIASTLAQAVVKDLPRPPPPPPDDDDDPPPPPPPGGPDLDLSQEATSWIALVPANVRGETFKHPISGEVQTRQQAVGRTFTEVGQVAKDVGSMDGVDIMLSIGLAPGFMPDASKWKPFADKVDAALEHLKTQGVTVEQYGLALQSIGRALN